MDQGPLVSEQIAAGARFLKEFEKYKPVAAAFWLKAEEDSLWFLYVASDQIDDTNFDLAYGEVLRISGELQDPWLNPFRVKVVGVQNPVARGVLDFLRRFPVRLPERIYKSWLNGVSLEEAYIYQLPITAAA